MSVISSVMYSDKDAIESIIELHNNGKPFDLDPCFSIGNFYNKTGIPFPKYRFDITPLSDDVIKADVSNLPITKKVNSIIFDPPFMFGTHGQTKNNIMNKRFTMFDSFEELENMYKGALKEFYRILNKKGIVAFKCQDYTDSKTTMTHCLVYNWAIEQGFYAKDLFVLIFPRRVYNPALKQRHARKFHSYWWIFQKNSK
jgi:hypothetical protein